MPLQKINQEQKKRLLEIGVNVTDDTLVLEMLQLFRNDYYNEINGKIIYIPYKYVNVYSSAYYRSKVHGYIPVTGTEKDHGVNYCEVGDKQGIWYSIGRHSWEDAESDALDYIINNEIPFE